MKRSYGSFVTGALILTASGILSRIMGFFYRIFLSNVIGEEGMGIYQLSSSVAMLCLSFCAMGFQTSISRFVASAGDDKSARTRYLTAGIGLSLALSVPTAAFVYVFSEEIACCFLMERQCQSLLQLIALSIPFASLHSCMCGYYLGCKKASIPALSQLVEQAFRVGSVWILWKILTSHGESITAFHAMVGTLISEFGNILFLGLVWFLSDPKPETSSQTGGSNSAPGLLFCVRQIFFLTLPLTANRLVISFLQSVEGAMIPGQLRLGGMESSQALGTYGVLTGMVMPFLLFPSALSGSAALMLLPSIASAQSRHDDTHIQKASDQNIQFCLWLGIFSWGAFLLYGKDIGNAVFHSPLAGHFMETLSWLCPFLYLTPTMGSILNGLGQTKTVFFHNLWGLLLRLLAVFLLIPSMGIKGYLLGLLGSQLLTCGFHFWTLHKTAGISFFPWRYIGIPFLLTAATGLIGKGVYMLSQNRTSLPPMLCILIGLGTMGLLFLWPAAASFISEPASRQKH